MEKTEKTVDFTGHDGIAFEDITLRINASGRGGGVEISLDEFGFPGEKMAAYQNYLGGGMLGRVCVNDTITAYENEEQYPSEKIAELEEIGDKLKRYFHAITNPSDEEWESQSYDQNQEMPESAY